MDRKSQTALLIGKCDHCLRSPHRAHYISARRGSSINIKFKIL